MKGVVDKGELQKKLADIQNVVDKKNTMPILNHFLLTVAKERSFITATDLETAFKEPIDVTVAEEGSMCIPAKKLFEIVREVDDEVSIESVDSQWVKVKSGRSHFRLACLSDSEFPVWPRLEDTEQIVIPSATLLEIIDRTLYAAGESDTRYVLNGLLFHLKTGDMLTVVGTDGHRLALSEKGIGTEFKEEKKVILSRKAVAELRRFLHDEGRAVKVIIGKNHIQFVIDEIEFLTRLIEGTYPNYEQVIPSGNEKMLTVDRDALIRSLRRVSVMSKEKSNAIKIDIESENIIISASNPDMGEAKDELSVAYSGEPMSMAFNARYLLDALSAMISEKVTFKLNEPLSAVLVMEDGREDYKCVVMPMRI